LEKLVQDPAACAILCHDDDLEDVEVIEDTNEGDTADAAEDSALDKDDEDEYQKVLVDEELVDDESKSELDDDADNSNSKNDRTMETNGGNDEEEDKQRKGNDKEKESENEEEAEDTATPLPAPAQATPPFRPTDPLSNTALTALLPRLLFETQSLLDVEQQRKEANDLAKAHSLHEQTLNVTEETKAALEEQLKDTDETVKAIIEKAIKTNTDLILKKIADQQTPSKGKGR
jgi:hypothetical protein